MLFAPRQSLSASSRRLLGRFNIIEVDVESYQNSNDCVLFLFNDCIVLAGKPKRHRKQAHVFRYIWSNSNVDLVTLDERGLLGGFMLTIRQLGRSLCHAFHGEDALGFVRVFRIANQEAKPAAAESFDDALSVYRIWHADNVEVVTTAFKSCIEYRARRSAASKTHLVVLNVSDELDLNTLSDILPDTSAIALVQWRTSRYRYAR